MSLMPNPTVHLPADCVDQDALHLPAHLTPEAWGNIGTHLQRNERGAMWFLGDWLLYGEEEYGETRAQQYAEWLDTLSQETVRGARWVCSRIPAARRVKGLTWSHHKLVAALPPDEQDEWLAWAKEHDVVVAHLRNKLKKEAVVPSDAPMPDPEWKHLHEAADETAPIQRPVYGTPENEHPDAPLIAHGYDPQDLDPDPFDAPTEKDALDLSRQAIGRLWSSADHTRVEGAIRGLMERIEELEALRRYTYNTGKGTGGAK